MKKVLLFISIMLIAFMGFNSSNVNAEQGEDYLIDVGDTTKVFFGENVEFEYEAINGEIVNMSTNIDEEDYTIEDSKIVIKEDFIRDVINDNPDREMLILGYVFESSDKLNYVIGYLFIDLQSGKYLYQDEYPTVANPNLHDYAIEMRVIPKCMSFKNIEYQELAK